MTSIVARVTSTGTEAPLARLLTAPLGLDVWELTAEHVVLRVEEAQADRLESMGYGVEQLQGGGPGRGGGHGYPQLAGKRHGSRRKGIDLAAVRGG